MTAEFRFECPRCGSRQYGTITRGNGSQAYACHGIIQVDRLRNISRSCDFEIPIKSQKPPVTLEQREALLRQIIKDHESVGHSLTFVDLGDERGLREIVTSIGQLRHSVTLLADDAVTARHDSEQADGATP